MKPTTAINETPYLQWPSASQVVLFCDKKIDVFKKFKDPLLAIITRAFAACMISFLLALETWPVPFLAIPFAALGLGFFTICAGAEMFGAALIISGLSLDAIRIVARAFQSDPQVPVTTCNNPAGVV